MALNAGCERCRAVGDAFFDNCNNILCGNCIQEVTCTLHYKVTHFCTNTRRLVVAPQDQKVPV